jgi:hypothetical protein
MNYALSRIVPPAGVMVDPRKRPVVVVDPPRAGQGPGIGGFKAEGEIGDALDAGHPVRRPDTRFIDGPVETPDRSTRQTTGGDNASAPGCQDVACRKQCSHCSMKP